jgi:catechol 2,3-dioxygenase-like lactoylglutathione lyase family enzyme
MSTTANFGFAVRHLGINCSDSSEAQKVCELFASIFGFPCMDDKTDSVFSGPTLEIMKGGGRGRLGHIAISTTDIDAAVAYLQGRGVALDPSSIKRDKNGRITVIYLRDEIAGMAIHLLRQ